MNSKNSHQSTLLSFIEACEYLNVKSSWLRMAIFKKQIPHKKLGRLIRFELNELNDWINRNSVKKSEGSNE